MKKYLALLIVSLLSLHLLARYEASFYEEPIVAKVVYVSGAECGKYCNYHYVVKTDDGKTHRIISSAYQNTLLKVGDTMVYDNILEDYYNPLIGMLGNVESYPIKSGFNTGNFLVALLKSTLVSLSLFLTGYLLVNTFRKEEN